ncbi:MAG: hypothetical protein R2800_03785 [Flavipsychrobacter sp.]
MDKILVLIATIILSKAASSQSLEVMAGTKNIFTDVQWLKPINKKRSLSVFNRTRATVDYQKKTNLFTGTYINYTIKKGIGITALGRLSTNNAGGDVGIHYFRSSKNVLIFALLSTEIGQELNYSWFSIIRYRPKINYKWKVYTSLELYTLMNNTTHILSVQRVRLGLENKYMQMGIALNLTELNTLPNYNNNTGIFIRKDF